MLAKLEPGFKRRVLPDLRIPNRYLNDQSSKEGPTLSGQLIAAAKVELPFLRSAR